MKAATKTGLHFGLTSGVITTLGLIVGLHSGTHSELAVTGGILTIAVADALSDALGIHISQEGNPDADPRSVWLATASTLVTKMLMALSFVLPVLLLELSTAIVVSVVWGLLVLTLLSLQLARERGVAPAPVVLEHLLIAVLVVVVTHYLGDAVARYLG